MRWARPGSSPGCGLPALLLALLLLLLLLRGGCLGEDPLFHPDWGFESYELTTPTRLRPQGGQRAGAGQVSYRLHVRGERRVLQLRPKRLLLPRNLRVFSFTKRGHVVEDHPYIPRDCNYGGVVEGVQDSEVTVSTCMGGLRGVLQLHGAHYQIEPLAASPTSEHVVYLLKKEGLSLNHTCVITDDDDGDGDGDGDETERQVPQHEDMARARDFIHSYKHTKYLELVVIFDHGRYLYSNSNLTQVISDGIIMTGIMDTYYHDIGLKIHLSALEVWTNGNKVNMNVPHLTMILQQLRSYRRTSINYWVPNDWVHLYLNKKNTKPTLALGKLCTRSLSGSLSSFLGKNLYIAATWASHALGHVLGMEHDTEYCACRGHDACIMGYGTYGFSNCSYSDFVAFISVSAHCLNNIPGSFYMAKRCGNKIVEGVEECDCGSHEECKKDHCCESGCKLRQGANCSSGLCCHKCHFSPSGNVCRKEENECDLAEYCSGQSALCPDDFYKQDGTPCRYEAVCFRKMCQSRYMQCQLIFGPDAREAPYQCYMAVNTIGDQYGNCKMSGVNSYEKCSKASSICGRIQCINVKSLPGLPDHSTIISTHLGEENLRCWGLGYHLSMAPMGLPDVGAIHDGTSCGKDRVCINGTCVEKKSILDFDCLPEQCNHRGVCNNKRHCHCMMGWAPPFCEQAGDGGSIDSGPPPPFKPPPPTWAEILSLVSLRFTVFAVSALIVFFRDILVKCLKPMRTEGPPIITELEQLQAMKSRKRRRKPVPRQ